MKLLDRLDRYATDEAGFNEGHPEDRCPLCEWPVADHLGEHYAFQATDGDGWIGDGSAAKWPHRRAAAAALLLSAIRQRL